MNEESVLLLSRFRAGDETAADEIFHRYVKRLVGVAQARISEKLGNRLDAEDVVQSVYRSFFVRAAQGQYVTERSGDLWRLLASITINKVRLQARHHRRGKRSIDRESAARTDGEGDALAQMAAGPGETDAIAFMDELESVMAELPDRRRTVLELRLQGRSVPEIADAVGRSQRSILRFLDESRKLLEDRLHRSSAS